MNGERKMRPGRLLSSFSEKNSRPDFLARSMRTINFPPVAHGQSQDHQLIVLDLADQAVVPDPVSPLSAAVCCQAFPVLPGVHALDKVLFNPRLYHALRVPVQLLKLFVKPLRRFYAIFHKSRSFHSAEMGLLFSPPFT